MSTKAFLGIDVGGTGAKAAVFDHAGRLLGAARRSYAPQITPQGYAEIPIETIYMAARDAARQAVHASGVPIAALSFAVQGQTFTVLDAQDRPLHPAILWYDSRGAYDAAEMAQVLRTEQDLLVEAIAAAPKILWLRRHHPSAMEQARRYLLLPDYFSYRLCGQAVTDPCTASTTALLAEGALRYSEKALQYANIHADELARVQPSGSVVARVSADAAEEWGLSTDTLIVVGTNDQYAGALGAGNCRPGILSETTGTCLALVTLFPTAALPAMHFPPGLMPGRFPIEEMSFALAYAKTAGLVVDWMTTQFAGGKSLTEMEALAAQSPPGSRGVTVLPHFDGMVSPVPSAEARGAILNLNLSHTLADVYRALLESIAFSLRQNIELMRDAGMQFAVIRSIGGGARSDLWLQIKADVTGLPVERPAVPEAATLGAAMLAAVGAGEYGSVRECSESFYRPERVFLPDAQMAAEYDAPYNAYRELYRKLYG